MVLYDSKRFIYEKILTITKTPQKRTYLMYFYFIQKVKMDNNVDTNT